MTWTDARIESLKVLLADPEKLSATEIMAALGGGVSRNAVIGKVRRLGLTLPNERNNAPVTRIRVKRNGAANGHRHVGTVHKIGRRTKRQRFNADPDGNRRRSLSELDAALEATDLTPDESPDAVTLLGLTDDTCRWPLGDPATPEFRFCGTDKHSGYPYCARHARMAYSRGRAA